MTTQALFSKVVIGLHDKDESHPTTLTKQLKAYLQENLGTQSKVLEGAEYIAPRTEPEGAATLGLNEIILLFGSGAGLALLQQVVSLLVEWLKAKKQSSVSIEIDSIKITVSRATHPEELALKLFEELEAMKRKQGIIRP